MTKTPFVRGARLSDALERELRRVLRNQKLARQNLDTDAIHDLRVALRRCRSLAEGFSEMDHRLMWRELRKACGDQQRDLGELRDIQVMSEWITRLRLGKAPGAARVRDELKRQERRMERKARASLKSFSRKQWKQWRQELPAQAGELYVGEARLAKIAFERIDKICVLDRRWRRTRSSAAWHRLRVGVKRLRYAMESFLPVQHEAWRHELKHVQDLLGEGHDLDVMRSWVLREARKLALSQRAQKQWLAQISKARVRRTEGYARAVSVPARAKQGKQAFLWDRWRQELGVLAKLNPADVAGHAPSSAMQR